MAQRLAGETVSVGGPTIAEGIAVRDIGELPLDIVRQLGIEVLVVPERAIEQAIGLLIEGAKTVAEGAGAAGVSCVAGLPGAVRRQAASACRSPAATSTRASCRTCCCAICCATAACCGCIMQIPDRPGVLADIAGQDRCNRRQYHRGLAPAPVRRRIGAGGGAGSDGRGPRSRARRSDHGVAARIVTWCGGSDSNPPLPRRGRGRFAKRTG